MSKKSDKVMNALTPTQELSAEAKKAVNEQAFAESLRLVEYPKEFETNEDGSLARDEAGEAIVKSEGRYEMEMPGVKLREIAPEVAVTRADGKRVVTSAAKYEVVKRTEENKAAFDTDPTLRNVDVTEEVARAKRMGITDPNEIVADLKNRRVWGKDGNSTRANFWTSDAAVKPASKVDLFDLSKEASLIGNVDKNVEASAKVQLAALREDATSQADAQAVVREMGGGMDSYDTYVEKAQAANPGMNNPGELLTGYLKYRQENGGDSVLNQLRTSASTGLHTVGADTLQLGSAVAGAAVGGLGKLGVAGLDPLAKSLGDFAVAAGDATENMHAANTAAGGGEAAYQIAKTAGEVAQGWGASAAIEQAGMAVAKRVSTKIAAREASGFLTKLGKMAVRSEGAAGRLGGTQVVEATLASGNRDAIAGLFQKTLSPYVGSLGAGVQSGSMAAADMYSDTVTKLRADNVERRASGQEELSETEMAGLAGQRSASTFAKAAAITFVASKLVPGGLEEMEHTLGEGGLRNVVNTRVLSQFSNREFLAGLKAVGGREFLQEAATAALKSVGAIGLNGVSEAFEEGGDELMSGLLGLLEQNPNDNLGKIFERTFEAAKMGGIAGVGLTAGGRAAKFGATTGLDAAGALRAGLTSSRAAAPEAMPVAVPDTTAEADPASTPETKSMTAEEAAELNRNFAEKQETAAMRAGAQAPLGELRAEDGEMPEVVAERGEERAKALEEHMRRVAEEIRPEIEANKEVSAAPEVRELAVVGSKLKADAAQMDETGMKQTADALREVAEAVAAKQEVIEHLARGRAEISPESKNAFLEMSRAKRAQADASRLKRGEATPAAEEAVESPVSEVMPEPTSEATSEATSEPAITEWTPLMDVAERVAKRTGMVSIPSAANVYLKGESVVPSQANQARFIDEQAKVLGSLYPVVELTGAVMADLPNPNNRSKGAVGVLVNLQTSSKKGIKVEQVPVIEGTMTPAFTNDPIVTAAQIMGMGPVPIPDGVIEYRQLNPAMVTVEHTDAATNVTTEYVVGVRIPESSVVVTTSPKASGGDLSRVLRSSSDLSGEVFADTQAAIAAAVKNTVVGHSNGTRESGVAREGRKEKQKAVAEEKQLGASASLSDQHVVALEKSVFKLLDKISGKSKDKAVETDEDVDDSPNVGGENRDGLTAGDVWVEAQTRAGNPENTSLGAAFREAVDAGDSAAAEQAAMKLANQAYTAAKDKRKKQADDALVERAASVDESPEMGSHLEGEMARAVESAEPAASQVSGVTLGMGERILERMKTLDPQEQGQVRTAIQTTHKTLTRDYENLMGDAEELLPADSKALAALREYDPEESRLAQLMWAMDVAVALAADPSVTSEVREALGIEGLDTSVRQLASLMKGDGAMQSLAAGHLEMSRELAEHLEGLTKLGLMEVNDNPGAVLGALEKIIQDPNGSLDPQLVKSAQVTLAWLKAGTTSPVVVTTISDPTGAAGAYSYDKATNTHHILLNAAASNGRGAADVFLHEMNHAMVYDIIKKPVTKEHKELAGHLLTVSKRIQDAVNEDPKIFDRYAESMRSLAENLGYEGAAASVWAAELTHSLVYGLGYQVEADGKVTRMTRNVSLAELSAHVATSGQVLTWLHSNVAPKLPRTLLQKITDGLRSFFGLLPRSLDTLTLTELAVLPKRKDRTEVAKATHVGSKLLDKIVAQRRLQDGVQYYKPSKLTGQPTVAVVRDSWETLEGEALRKLREYGGVNIDTPIDGKAFQEYQAREDAYAGLGKLRGAAEASVGQKKYDPRYWGEDSALRERVQSVYLKQVLERAARVESIRGTELNGDGVYVEVPQENRNSEMSIMLDAFPQLNEIFNRLAKHWARVVTGADYRTGSDETRAAMAHTMWGKFVHRMDEVAPFQRMETLGGKGWVMPEARVLKQRKFQHVKISTNEIERVLTHNRAGLGAPMEVIGRVVGKDEYVARIPIPVSSIAEIDLSDAESKVSALANAGLSVTRVGEGGMPTAFRGRDGEVYELGEKMLGRVAVDGSLEVTRAELALVSDDEMGFFGKKRLAIQQFAEDVARDPEMAEGALYSPRLGEKGYGSAESLRDDDARIFAVLHGAPVGEAVSGALVRGVDENGDPEKVSSMFKRWLRENPQDELTLHSGERVLLNEKSMDDTVFHGIGKEKFHLLPLVPDVIHRGAILDSSMDFEGDPILNRIVAAPVTLDGKEMFLIARLRSDTDHTKTREISDPHFYVHEVLALDSKFYQEAELDAAIQTAAKPTSEDAELYGSGIKLYAKILHAALQVKSPSEKSSGDVLESRAAAMRVVEMKPIRMEVEEWENLTAAERKKKAVGIVKAENERVVAGEPIVNADRGREIRLGVNATKHFMRYASDPRKAAVFGKIREVLEQAKYLRSEKPDARKTDKNIKAFHRFAVMTDVGVVSPFLLTVQEDANGGFLYDGEILDTKVPANGTHTSKEPDSADDSDSTTYVSRGHVQSILDALDVNRELQIGDWVQGDALYSRASRLSMSGEQEASLREKLGQPVNALEISGEGVPKNLRGGALKNFVNDFIQEKLQGRRIGDFFFTKQSRLQMQKHAGDPYTAAAVHHIEEVIPEAIFIGSEPSRDASMRSVSKQEKSAKIEAYHHYLVPTKIDGVMHVTWFTATESNTGKYETQTFDTIRAHMAETRSRTQHPSSGLARVAGQEASDKETLAQVLGRVNPEFLRNKGLDRLLPGYEEGAAPLESRAVKPYGAAVRESEVEQPGDVLYTFRGQRSALAKSDVESLGRARKLAGVLTPMEVWGQTGWFRGVDGLWRSELDDSRARVNAARWKKAEGLAETTEDAVYGAMATGKWKGVPHARMKLSELFGHDGLYAAYPFLKETDVVVAA